MTHMINEKGLSLFSMMSSLPDGLILESDITARPRYTRADRPQSPFGRFVNSGWGVAMICTLVSLGVVLAILMAGRNAPPVIDPPAGSISGGETEETVEEVTHEATEMETEWVTDQATEAETKEASDPGEAFTMSEEELALLQAAREALFVPDDETTDAIVQAMIQNGDTTWGVYPHKWRWVDANGNIWDGVSCYGIFDKCIIFVQGNHIGDYFEVPPVGGVDLPDRLFYYAYCEGTLYTVDEAYQKGYVTSGELTLVVKRMADAEKYEVDVFNDYCRNGKLLFISVWDQYEGT